MSKVVEWTEGNVHYKAKELPNGKRVEIVGTLIQVPAQAPVDPRLDEKLARLSEAKSKLSGQSSKTGDIVDTVSVLSEFHLKGE
jgi:hypothetical protein